MSLFLNLLFETDSYSNEYLLAKVGVDTAENEPLEFWGKIIQYYSFVSLGALGSTTHDEASCTSTPTKSRRFRFQEAAVGS